MKQIQDIEFMVGEDTEVEDGDIICYRKDIEKLIDSIISYMDVVVNILYNDDKLSEEAFTSLKQTLSLLEEAKQ